jgi:hypothetical protein
MSHRRSPLPGREKLVAPVLAIAALFGCAAHVVRPQAGRLAAPRGASAAFAGPGLTPKRSGRPNVAGAPRNSGRPPGARVQEAYAGLPLSFEANRGQTDGRVKFISRGAGYNLFLASDEAVLALSKPGVVGADGEHAPARRSAAAGRHEPPAVLRMKLVGARPTPKVEGVGELPGRSNYFKGGDPGGWRTNVPLYTKVRYESVYPGVDLVYYGNQRQLEYDFHVAPGANPALIRLAFGARPRAGCARRPPAADGVRRGGPPAQARHLPGGRRRATRRGGPLRVEGPA